MIPLPTRKKPTLGQLVFGEITAPFEFDEDEDHPLKVERPKSDGMEAKASLPDGLPREIVIGKDGDDVLTGYAGDDSLGFYSPTPLPSATSDGSRSAVVGVRAFHGGGSDAFPDVTSYLSPTDDPVDAEALYKFLRFDPKGPGHRLQAIYDVFSNKSDHRTLPSQLTPAAAEANAKSTMEEVKALTGIFRELASLDKKININPEILGFNDAIDAFRHALWSFKMARAVGPRDARNWGNAHEVEGRESVPGERLMDLYNNNVGHRLAMDSRNKDREPKDVIMEALKNGLLQTRPFNIQAK